jgi:hypothetical protein
MSVERARKQAFFAAVAAILIGGVAVIAVVIIYVLYGSWLDNFSQQEANATTNAFLVKAVKAAGFRLVPGLSVLLIAVGASTLFYLGKERAAVSR